MKTALDIGCGLGGISIALAKEDIYVTALDISALAIEILKQRVEQYKLNNIKVINDDFKKITIKEKYDIVIVSYVMGLISTENLDKLLSLTNKYLVFVLPTEGFKNDFSIQELYKRINRDLFTLKQRTHMDVIRILKEKDIRYEVKFFEAQFNQPICSIEGGLKFIKYYFKISENYEKDIMKWLNEKIRVNHNGLYIPSFRKSSIIVLKK